MLYKEINFIACKNHTDHRIMQSNSVITSRTEVSILCSYNEVLF